MVVMTGLVNLTVADGIAHLELSDPRTRNSIGSAMACEIVAACERIDADPDVGVTIVSGSDGYFCSGAKRDELAAIAADPYAESSRARLSQIYAAFTRVGELLCPTIAAVQGGAVGAGMNLLLACDVRVVAEDATLVGFSQLGVHPGGGNLSLLMRSGGRESAVVVAALGKSLTGREAVSRGLCWSAPVASEVEEEATRLASAAGKDPVLARSVMASLRAESGPPQVSWAVAVELERAEQMRSFSRSAAKLTGETRPLLS
jgi:enoyl-CoA hydratase